LETVNENKLPEQKILLLRENMETKHGKKHMQICFIG